MWPTESSGMRILDKDTIMEGLLAFRPETRSLCAWIVGEAGGERKNYLKQSFNHSRLVLIPKVFLSSPSSANWCVFCTCKLYLTLAQVQPN